MLRENPSIKSARDALLSPELPDVDLLTALRCNSRYLSTKPALIDDYRSMTFAELWARSRSVQTSAAELGIEPGDRVALAWSSNNSHVLLLVGLLLAGCTVVPLNTRLSKRELADFVARVDPRLVVTDRTCQELVEGLDRSVVLGMADGDRLNFRFVKRIAHRQTLPPFPWAAFVVGTGGTTGTPKGAVISRKAAALWALSSAFSQRLLRNDVELYGSPFFHATILTNLLAPLSLGATVRIVPRCSTEAVSRAVVHDGVTRIGGAPTIITKALEGVSSESAKWRNVRLISFGGAKPPSGFIDEVRHALPWSQLLTGYGSTEFGPVSRRFDEDFQDGFDASVGRPVPNARLLVRHSETNEFTDIAGAAGEIAVQCPWRFSGYLGSPLETESTILTTGQVLLGDIGHFDDSGELFISGRSKEMIITGGENVFPLEVEAVLAQHPAVKEVAVYGVADRYWGEHIEAAVVLQSACSLTLEELRQFSRPNLPGYKLPRTMSLVDQLPLTSNNKVDRRALSRARKPDGSESDG